MTEIEQTKKRKSRDRDGVYKRRGHWHFDYKDPQTGQWRSKTTGKTSYNDAKEFKREFLESLSGQYNPSNDRMKFTEAADAYIEHRKVAAAPGTVRLEKERLRAVKKLLSHIAPADLKLKDIDLKLVRKYQQRRIAEGVGPRTVNMEGQLMRSILKHHEQWKLDGKYEPLPEPVSEAGRTLTSEEEVRLLDTAKSCSRWFVAYHATVLENETGMRGVEVRNLQSKRIDFTAGEGRTEGRTGEVAGGPARPNSSRNSKRRLRNSDGCLQTRENLVVQVQLERGPGPGIHEADEQAYSRADGGYPQNLFSKR